MPTLEAAMRATRGSAFAVAGLALCAVAQAGAAGHAPGPDESLRRVAPDLGFSVAVPDADWVCISGGPHGYKCHPKNGDVAFATFAVFVSEPAKKDLTSDDVGEFVRGSVAGAQKRGWKTREPTLEASIIPFPGSTRFTYEAEASEPGPSCTFVGYIGQDQSRRQITFMHLARGKAEPPIFRSFVQSFRWSGNVPQPLEGIGTTNAIAAATLTLLTGSVGWVINRIKGRVAVNLWKLAIVLLVAGGAGLSIVWLPRIPDGLSPFDQGQVFGYTILGPVLCPALFALWRARALGKRRALEGCAPDAAGPGGRTTTG